MQALFFSDPFPCPDSNFTRSRTVISGSLTRLWPHQPAFMTGPSSVTITHLQGWTGCVFKSTITSCLCAIGCCRAAKYSGRKITNSLWSCTETGTCAHSGQKSMLSTRAGLYSYKNNISLASWWYFIYKIPFKILGLVIFFIFIYVFGSLL